MSQNLPVYELPFLYISGLTISWGSNTTLSIAAGQCRDSTDSIDIPLGSAPLNGVTTAAPLTLNFAINGVNGLDTGTIAASTTYAIYMLADSSYKNPVGAIATLASNSTPITPFGYDSVRLIGFWSTDSSSHLLLGYMSGAGNAKIFMYDAPQATSVTAGAATTYTAVDLSALVPPINNLPIYIFSALTPAAAGHGVFLQGGTSTGDQIVNLGQVTSVVLNSYDNMLAQLTSSLPKINYKVTNGSDAVAIKVAGYEFFV